MGKTDKHTAYQGDNIYDFDNEILLTWYPKQFYITQVLHSPSWNWIGARCIADIFSVILVVMLSRRFSCGHENLEKNTMVVPLKLSKGILKIFRRKNALK